MPPHFKQIHLPRTGEDLSDGGGGLMKRQCAYGIVDPARLTWYYAPSMEKSEISLKGLKLGVQPQVLAGIMQLDDTSDLGFRELDRLIKADQNMATLILKAANSPLYSRGVEIRSLQVAISLLGFRVIRSLATVVASSGLFQSGTYARFRKYVWQHSVVTAVIARQIVMQTGLKDLSEDAFVGGLLHDLGKIILNTIDRQAFISVIDTCEADKVGFVAAERRIFGVDHQEIGKRAAQEWALPPLYALVMSSHEGGDAALWTGAAEKDKHICYAVTLGNYLAQKNGYGLPSGPDDKTWTHAASALGLTEGTLAALEKNIVGKIEEDEHYRFFITVI